MPPTEKKCIGCKKVKPLSEYHNRSDNWGDGTRSRCKPCMRLYGIKYRSTKSGIDNHRRAGLKRRFGMTLETYDNMFIFQGGVCAICGGVEVRTFKGAVVRLAVDHDHKTGKIRRLLCYRCNSVLGFVNDDISLLSKCIKYLRKY